MANSPIVLGYYSSWQTGLPPAKIDFRPFTHLTHAFARIDPTSRAVMMPAAAPTRDLLHRAHQAGVKVLLALGGAGSGTALRAVNANEHAIGLLAARLSLMIDEAGYDGLDVDWEFPENADDAQRMNDFVGALRTALGKKIVSMAIPASDWSGKWFQTDALARHVDFVNVMTYDFSGEWSSRAGHNAGMQDTQTGIRYWTEQRHWPRAKLNVGIPLYGRGFRAARFGDAAHGEYVRSSVAARDLSGLRRAGWKDGTPSIDGPFLVAPDGSEVLGYDDARTVRAKGALARREKLAGVFFWEVSQDEPGLPLVRAARAGLLGLS